MDEQALRSFIFGGPGDHKRWTIMVILAARADDSGLVDTPTLADMALWIGQTEGWAKNCEKHLLREGWVRPAGPGKWQIRDLHTT